MKRQLHYCLAHCKSSFLFPQRWPTLSEARLVVVRLWATAVRVVRADEQWPFPGAPRLLTRPAAWTETGAVHLHALPALRSCRDAWGSAAFHSDGIMSAGTMNPLEEDSCRWYKKYESRVKLMSKMLNIRAMLSGCYYFLFCFLDVCFMFLCLK